MKAPARCLAAGGHFFLLWPRGKTEKAEKKTFLISILILFAKIITEG